MRRELRTLFWADSLANFAAGLFGPIYAVFVEEIGGDLLTAGAAYSVFAIVSGLAMYLISKWENRSKHKEMILIFSYFLSTLGFLGYLFVKTPIHLFIVQIIFGISVAFCWPVFDGLFSKWLDKGKFVYQWGSYDALWSILSGISALIGGALANFYGFRFLFFIMFFISLIGLMVSLFLISKKKSKKKK